MSLASIAPTNPRPTLPAPVPPADRAFGLDDDSREHVLVVEVQGVPYGIPVAQTREVVRAPRLTRVPGAPRETLGIVNLRGAVVTVLDLAVILGRGRAEAGASIVLIENGARLVGFAVDGVREVRALETDADGSVPAGGLATLDTTALCARFLISAEEMGR
jgi:chemotaxis signal transduction protein